MVRSWYANGILFLNSIEAIICLLMIDVWVILWWLKDFLLIRCTISSIFANQIFCVKHMVFLRGFPYRYAEELGIFAPLMFFPLFPMEDILCSNFPLIFFSVLMNFFFYIKKYFAEIAGSRWKQKVKTTDWF